MPTPEEIKAIDALDTLVPEINNAAALATKKGHQKAVLIDNFYSRVRSLINQALNGEEKTPLVAYPQWLENNKALVGQWLANPTLSSDRKNELQSLLAGKQNKKQEASINGESVIIYSARMTSDELARGQYRLGIKFTSPQARDNFIHEFNEQARDQKIVISGLITKIRDNLDTLYIEPSKGRGSLGVFISLSGELSINLGNQQLRDYFVSKTSLSEKEATIPEVLRGQDSIYFKKELLPPYSLEAEKMKLRQNITTKPIHSEKAKPKHS